MMSWRFGGRPPVPCQGQAWVPAPRFREDKLRGDDEMCAYPSPGAGVQDLDSRFRGNDA